MNYVMEHGMPVAEQPLADNAVTQEIIARRALIALMITGNRYFAVGKLEPIHPMPRPFQEFYEEEHYDEDEA